MDCKLAKGEYIKYSCFLCGERLPPRRRKWCSAECVKTWYTLHNWNAARKAAKRRDKYRCVECGSKDDLQVDHIEPVWGAGYGWSCRNHQDNLQTLCLTHHQAKTRQQMAERKEKK